MNVFRNRGDGGGGGGDGDGGVSYPSFFLYVFFDDIYWL